MPKATKSPTKSLRTKISPKILLEVDELVLTNRVKSPHVKGKPYAAEWLWGLTKHPKTRHLFKDEVVNG